MLLTVADSPTYPCYREGAQLIIINEDIIAKISIFCYNYLTNDLVDFLENNDI